MIAQTLDEYLGMRGVSSPISDYMLDKCRIPHGQTDRQEKQMIKDALLAIDSHHEKRAQAIREYYEKVTAGEIRDKTKVERLLTTANGHPDNESTQAARRRLGKMGIPWTGGDHQHET